MTVQNGAHDVHEFDVAVLPIDPVTSHHVPAGMSVVALAAFADLNRGLHFQAGRFGLVHHLGVDEVGVSLMRIVLVRGVLVQGIAKEVGDQPAEIVSLDI